MSIKKKIADNLTKKQRVLELLLDNHIHYGSELKLISPHYKDYIAQFRKDGLDIKTRNFGNNIYAYQIERNLRPAFTRSEGQLVLF
jgi:hypothetical protein